MKKEKIIKLISLPLELFAFGATAYVIIKAIFFGYEFADITVPPYQFSYFQYFTNLSNIYAGLVALFLFVYTIIHLNDDSPLPKWLSLVALSAATGVALTFLTVLFFLAPTYAMKGNNYFVMFMDDMIFTHFLTPVICSIVFVLFLKHEKINFKEAMFGVIPMALYASVYSPMVLTHTWDDFYGFTFGGNGWLIFLVLPIMICVTYLISFGLATLANLRQK